MDHDDTTETTSMTELEYGLAVREARHFAETLNSLRFDRLEVCYRVGRIHATRWDGTKVTVSVPLRWLVPIGVNMDRDTLARHIRDAFRAIVIEADEWRPLAGYIISLIRMGAIPPMSGADAVEAERKANRPPQSNADWNEAAEVHDG